MRTTIYLPLLLLLLSGQVVAAGIPAQPDRGAITLQYTPGNDYETVMGMGIYSFRRSLPGFYFNAQVTTMPTSDSDDFYKNLTAASFGHPVTGYISDFATVNAGTTYSVADRLGLYLGIGYVSVTGYAELYDSQRILDFDGYYLVPDPTPDENGANVNVGLLLFLGSVSVEVGYHSFIQKGYVGIGFAF